MSLQNIKKKKEKKKLGLPYRIIPEAPHTQDRMVMQNDNSTNESGIKIPCFQILLLLLFLLDPFHVVAGEGAKETSPAGSAYEPAVIALLHH